MRAITRYVVFEFLKVFIMALVGLTLFMFLVVGAREAVRHGLGPGPILRILPFILPESMRFSIPTAALLAACITFGRMASDNEIVAIKSLGISPMAMMGPVIILAFLISLLAVWVNDVSVSWGLPGKRRTVVESIEEIVYGMLRTKRTFKNDRVVIIVKRVDGRRLVMPTITFLGDDDEDRFVVRAREAELRRNPENNTLSVLLTDFSLDSAIVEGAFGRCLRTRNSVRGQWRRTRRQCIRSGVAKSAARIGRTKTLHQSPAIVHGRRSSLSHVVG